MYLKGCWFVLEARAPSFVCIYICTVGTMQSANPGCAWTSTNAKALNGPPITERYPLPPNPEGVV